MRRVATILGIALLAGCASYGGDQVDPVEARLNALEQETGNLKDTLATQKRRLDGMSAVGLDSSVASLEERFRELRGKIEQLEYETRESLERQQSLFIDLDRRLQALEKGGASAAPRAASDNTDQKAYLAAFQQLKNGEYQASVASFENFLQKHAGSPYAANAQYWIGEAYYVQRNFDAAWKAFAGVLSQYPESSKAADALLKQAMVRQEQGKAAEARELFTQVTRRFPDSSAATLAKERLAAVEG